MIAVSPRYGRWLLVVLGLALVPVLLEEVRPRRHDDCRHPDMLTLTLAIPGSRPERSPERGRDDTQDRLTDHDIQWTHGEVEGGSAGTPGPRFSIVRSFDPARASPRSVLDGHFDPESHELREVESEAGPLPVHVAIDRTRRPTRLIAWTWVYDGHPTEDVLPALLAAAPRRLLTGAVPVTLLMVDGVTPGPDAGAVDALATRWLANAWTHMARYCR